VTPLQAKRAFDFFCNSPCVVEARRLHPKDTDIHKFYDSLLSNSDLTHWCKFAALVLILPTGNAISESGFSIMAYTKSKYRNALGPYLLDAQLLAHANGSSVLDFSKHHSLSLAVDI